MASSLAALLLAGGLGASVALILGLAFARSAARVIALGGIGALLACLYQIGVVGRELDPFVRELMNAAGTANALGWFAGTLLVARVRALEWLNAQEAAQG